jgi:hypothetical protein
MQLTISSISIASSEMMRMTFAVNILFYFISAATSTKILAKRFLSTKSAPSLSRYGIDIVRWVSFGFNSTLLIVAL